MTTRQKLLLALVLLASQAHAAEKIKLTLNWKPEPEFGGFYAAQTLNIYKDSGLDVQIQPGGSGTPVVQMIASGQTEFGIVSADEIVIARSHGADVVALFAVFQTSPQALMTHEEKRYTKMAEIFENPGTLSMEKGLPYAEFLNKRYLSPKVKIVPYSGAIGNFLSDRDLSQQCFVTSEPLAAKKKGIKVKTFLVADEGYNPYVTVLATRGDVLRKNPTLVKLMVDATRKGWSSYLAQPSATNQVMISLNKAMDVKMFFDIAQEQKPLIEVAASKDKLGSMSEGRWEQLVKQLLDLKIIDKTLEANAMFVNL